MIFLGKDIFKKVISVCKQAGWGCRFSLEGNSLSAPKKRTTQGIRGQGGKLWGLGEGDASRPRARGLKAVQHPPGAWCWLKRALCLTLTKDIWLSHQLGNRGSERLRRRPVVPQLVGRGIRSPTLPVQPEPLRRPRCLPGSG